MKSLLHLPYFISKMEKEGLPPVVTETFSYYYRQVVTGETGLIFDKDIMPVAPDEIKESLHLSKYEDAGKKRLKNAVRIILNGGLGTSMGLTCPKSLLEVKNGKSFLEIILEHTEKYKVKLALMNSFSTHNATLKALAEINPPHFPLTFLQYKFPKILQKDFSPPKWDKNPDLEWSPSGHGDIYTALFTSGMLQQLTDEGIIFAFISNSDNLGATLDEALLGYFSENQFPFMMEVAEKTPSDIKGGHLARHKNGRLLLREAAQCPDDELDSFRDIRKYRFFNTNNLWVNLKFLKELIEKEKKILLPMILNPKLLDPRDETSPDIFQIETAMGSAISLFEGATAVKVPRTRFFPVKKCSDLLVVRSDRFLFSDDKKLILNPDIRSENIRINLDSKFYGKTDLFDERFKHGIPSLTECSSLTIEGDFLFGKDVVLKGDVKLKNRGASQAVIPNGKVIEDAEIELV